MAKKNNGNKELIMNLSKDTKQPAINPKTISGSPKRYAKPGEKFPVDMSSDKSQPAINPK